MSTLPSSWFSPLSSRLGHHHHQHQHQHQSHPYHYHPYPYTTSDDPIPTHHHPHQYPTQHHYQMPPLSMSASGSLAATIAQLERASHHHTSQQHQSTSQLDMHGIGREINMERYDDIDASAEFDQLVSCDSLTLVGHDDGDAQQTCTPSSYHHRRRRKQKQKQKERERERDGTEGTGTGKDKSRGEGGRRSGKLGNEVIKNFNSNGNSTFVIRGSSRRSSGSHGGESGSGSRDEVVVFQNDGSSRNRNRIRNVTATSTATDDANTNDKTTTGSSTSGPSNNNNNNTNYSDNNMEVTSPHTKKDRLYHHAKTFSTSTLSLNSTFHSTSSSSASHSRSHSHSRSRSHSHSQYNHPSRTRPRPQSYDFLDPEPDSTFTGGGPLSPTGSVTNSVIFNVPFELKPSCDPKSVTISSNNNHEADCSDNSRSSSRSVVDTWSENNEEDEEERMKGLQDMIKTMEGNVLQLRKDEGDIETVLETMTSRLGALEIILDSVCHDNTNGQDKMQMVSNGTTSTSAGVLKLSKKSAGLHRRYLQLAMNRRRTELTVTIRAKYNAMTVVSDKQKELYRLQMSR